jgi:hypothetical protein
LNNGEESLIHFVLHLVLSLSLSKLPFLCVREFGHVTV